MLVRCLMFFILYCVNFYGIFPGANCNPINLKFIGIRSETRINKGHPNSTHGELRITASNLSPRDESFTRVLPPTGPRRIVSTTTELKEQVDKDYEGMEEPEDEEYSEDSTLDNAARVSYDEEVKNAWQRAHKKPSQKKPPLKKLNSKTGNKNCDNLKKPQTVKQNILKNKIKQHTTTTTEDNVQETTTKRYKGAVIAFQPAYQVLRNKVRQGLASTLFPYLTGEEVVGPVYGTVPLFPPPGGSPGAGSLWSRLWSWQKTS